MTTLVTYLGKPDLKVAFLGQLSEHERLDAFVHGTYGRMNGHFKGCGIGCSLHSLNVLQGKADPTVNTGQHDRYESELGIPLWLAYLEDNVFESLPMEAAKRWPRQLAEAIPVGVSIPDVLLAKILRWSLGDATYGCRHATDDAEVVAVVDRMIALFDREIHGDSPTPTEWDEAARAARDARAAWDVWAARDARAAWAAWAARAARAAFYPALAAYVLQELAALEPKANA